MAPLRRLLPLLALVALVPLPADAETVPRCHGKKATLWPGRYGQTYMGRDNYFVIEGTSGNDVIVGTPEDDEILGMGGRDRVCAGAGDDWLEGGMGKDFCDGGSGRDQFWWCEKRAR